MPAPPTGAEHTNIIKLGSLHDVRWCQYLWHKDDVVGNGAAVNLDHELFRLQAQYTDHGFLVLPLLKSRKTSALPVPKGMVGLYVFSVSEEDPLTQNLGVPAATSINKGHALDADENSDVVQLLFQAVILSLERLLHKDQLLRIGDCFFPRHKSSRSVGDQGARLRPFLIRSTEICVRVHAVDNPYQLLSCPGYSVASHTHAQLVPTGDVCEILHPSRSSLRDTDGVDSHVFSPPPQGNSTPESRHPSTHTSSATEARLRPACLETWAHAAPHLSDAVAAAPANMVRVRLQGVVGVYPQQLLAVPRRDDEQQQQVQRESGGVVSGGGGGEGAVASGDLKTVADRLWHRATFNGIAEGGLVLNSIAALNKRYGQLSSTITIPPPPPRPTHPGPHTRPGPPFRTGGRPMPRAARPPAKFPWGRQPKHARKRRHKFTLSLVKQQLQTVVKAGQSSDTNPAAAIQTDDDAGAATAAVAAASGAFGAAATGQAIHAGTSARAQQGAGDKPGTARPGAGFFAAGGEVHGAAHTESSATNDSKRPQEHSTGDGAAASKRGKAAFGSTHDAVPAKASGRRTAPDLLTPPYQDEDTLKPLLLQSQGSDDAVTSAADVLPTTPSSPPFAAALAPLAVGGTIKYPVPDAYKPLPCKANHSDNGVSWAPEGEGAYVDNSAMKGYQLHTRPKPPPPECVTLTKRNPHSGASPLNVEACGDKPLPQPGHNCDVQWQQPEQELGKEPMQPQERSPASAQFFVFVQYIYGRHRHQGGDRLPSPAVTRADAVLLEASCHLQLCDERPLVPHFQYTRLRYTHAKKPKPGAAAPKRCRARDSAACLQIMSLITHTKPFAGASRLSLSQLLPKSKPLVSPQVAVKTVMPTKQRDAVVTVRPSASTLWYHLGLRPYAGNKDWAAVPLFLCSKTHRPTAEWFLHRVVSAYTALNLGSISLHAADGLSCDPQSLSPPEVTQALRDLKVRLKRAAGKEPSRLLLLVVTDDGEWPPALAHPSAPEVLFPLAHVLMMRRDVYMQPNTHLNAACYELFRLNEAQHSAHKPMLQLAPTDLDADWVVALNTKLAFKQSLHLLHCAFVVLKDALALCLTDRHGSLLDVNFHEFTAGHALPDAATAAAATLLKVVRALRRPVHVLLCGIGSRAADAGTSLRQGLQPGPPPPREPKAGYLVSCTCVWFEWDDGVTVEHGAPHVPEAKLARLKQLREQKQQELEKRKQQRQRQQGKLGGMLRGARDGGVGASAVSSLGNFKTAGGRGGSSTLERYLRPGAASSRPMQSPHLRRHRNSNGNNGNNGKRTERELLPLLPELLQGATRVTPRMFVGVGAYFDASAAVRARRGHVQALYTLDERQWYRVTLLWRERACEDVITAHMTPRDFPLEDNSEEGVLEFVVQQFHHLAHLALPSGRPTVPVHVRSLSAFMPPLWERAD